MPRPFRYGTCREKSGTPYPTRPARHQSREKIFLIARVIPLTPLRWKRAGYGCSLRISHTCFRLAFAVFPLRVNGNARFDCHIWLPSGESAIIPARFQTERESRHMDNTGKKTDTRKKKDDIKWHPAFVIALQGTLLEYSDDLYYKFEHPLTTDPLKIDFLVVKKRPETVIGKQIAAIFRQENVIEYKRPGDSLSADEFHKTLAKTLLYKVFTKGVEISDLTLSFVVARKPVTLEKHLRGMFGYAMRETHPGISIVTGAMMPIQIVNVSKLSDDENLWLRNLNRNLPQENMRWVGNLDRKYGKRLEMGAYLHVVLTANQDKLNKEDFNMLTPRTRKIIEEIGWGEQWRQKYTKIGREEGKLEGKLEDARAMFAEGDSLAKMSRVTKIPLKRLKKELQAL
jgi:hypothetical protein